MIKVTALTGSKYDPSSRFRIRQFIKPLNELGVKVIEHWPLISRYKIEPLPWLAAGLRVPGLIASRFSDVSWLGRELISGRFSFEHLAGRKRVFDVDDAIWLPYARDFSAEIVEHCDGVIAGNRFLAEHYERLGAKVWLVPTSVDTDIWQPSDKERSAKWTIGWMGSSANLQFLSAIEEPLADFLAQHSDSRMLIVCDRPPAFKKLSCEFVPWTMKNEVSLVNRMDVGLMPLDDSELARGKCGFKMLSYMACALPVIATPVGVNAEILLRDEVGVAAQTVNQWFDALTRLHSDHELGVRMGQAGRKLVQADYSVAANAQLLADIFREVALSQGC
jgi:glycosyltransferase involved in cell wall biosynthesis